MIKVIFFDFAGTLVNNTGINSGGEFLGKGDIYYELKPKFKSGEISPKEFLDQVFECWKGLKVSDLKIIYNKFQFFNGVRETLMKIKELGIMTVLLSKLPIQLGQMFKDDIGFDFIFGNELEVVDGAFTGRVIKYQFDKLSSAQKFLEERNISTSEAIAIGDAHDDAPLFENLKFGIAFNGDDVANSKSKYQIKEFSEVDEIIIKENK